MRLVKTISILLMLGALGCSTPEGQNAVMYLSSVTIQERRIETAARCIDKITDSEASAPLDRQALIEAVKKAKQTAHTGKEELEKLHVPESAKRIHELYKQIFALNAQQTDLAEQIVNSADSQKNAEALKQLADIKNQIETLSQDILNEKRALSDSYQEVQLPEVSNKSWTPRPPHGSVESAN